MVILNKFTFDVTFPYDYSVYNIASQKSNMYDKTSSKNTMNTVLIRYDNVNRRQPLSSIHAYIYLVQVALNCILTVASYICHFIHSKREKINFITVTLQVIFCSFFCPALEELWSIMWNLLIVRTAKVLPSPLLH